MSKLSENQVKSLICNFFLFKGRFPAGTDLDKWEEVTMNDMEFDDPPLPGQPDLEKNRISDEIQDIFTLLDLRVDNMVPILSDSKKTMKDLWTACYTTQQEVSNV